MSSNKFLWHCDGQKYRDLITGENTCINLGNKVSCQWKLNVCKQIDTEGNMFLQFFLEAYCVDFMDGNRFVDVSVISQSSILINEQLVFSKPHRLTRKLGEINFRQIQNNELYVIGNVNYETSDVCEATSEVVTDHSTSPIDPCEVHSLQSFTEGLQSIFRDELFWDCVIICGSKSFRVHKLVLAARSPVFQNMFTTYMAEKLTNSVTIEDLDPEFLETFVHFLYGCQLKITSLEMAYNFLNAAEKYRIESLKEKVIDYLLKSLCVENAVDMLQMTDLYDKKLKASVIEYIYYNFNKIYYLSEWKNLKKQQPVLALEVYSFYE